jgi:hypothetical protein
MVTTTTSCDILSETGCHLPANQSSLTAHAALQEVRSYSMELKKSLKLLHARQHHP